MKRAFKITAVTKVQYRRAAPTIHRCYLESADACVEMAVPVLYATFKQISQPLSERATFKHYWPSYSAIKNCIKLRFESSFDHIDNRQRNH